MKKRALLALILLVVGFALEARRGAGYRGGHRGYRGRGYHRGYRGGYRGYRGYRYGRGWGWGPTLGVGLTIPFGGSSSSSYEVPVAPYKADDPYFVYLSRFPDSDPLKNRKAYRRWLYSNYPTDADAWWNFFVINRYNPYVARKASSRPAGYVSIGAGGYGPYGYRRGYW